MDHAEDSASRKPLAAEEEEEIRTLFPSYKNGDFVRFGKIGFVFPARFDLARIKSFPVYDDDVWLLTVPKCGTTWMQEILWLVKNHVDKIGAEANLFYRFPNLEFEYVLNPASKPYPPEETPQDDEHLREFLHHSCKFADKLPRPRMIKSHLPISLLPDKLLDTAKVIFLARNVKDLAVSYYHHTCLVQKDTNPAFKEAGFSAYVKLYKRGIIRNGPFLDTMLEAWEKRKEKNMHFVTYEDLKRDLDTELDRLLEFFGEQLAEEERRVLKSRVTLESFRKNKAVNKERELPHDPTSKERFVRKGMVGDWKNHFDKDCSQEWDKWIKEKLKGTGWNMTFELE